MNRTRSLIFALIVIGGLFFTFAVPPLQKPDEEAHFIRALAISKGLIFCNKQKRNTMLVDKGTVSMIAAVKKLGLPNHPERKFNLNLYAAGPFTTKQSSAQTTFLVDPIYCGFPIIPYIPHIIGIGIGELLHLNTYLVFFLGRLSMCMFAFIWMRWIYRRTPEIYRNGMLVIFGLPMFLHQIGAYSYDGVHILFACSILALVTSFYGSLSLLRKTGITDKIFLLFLLCVGFMLSKTGGYELVLLSIFLIPKQTIARTTTRYVLTIGAFFTALITVVGLDKYIELNGIAAGATLNKGVSPITQLMLIVHDPSFYILMLAKTTVHFGIFYLQSFIGILGWLEYGFPHWVYVLYIMIGIYSVIRTRIPSEFRLFTKKLLLLIMITAGTYVYIITIFYVLWNPVGVKITDGLQGRYFLPLAPFAYLLLAQLKQRIFPKLAIKHSPAWLTLLVMLSMTAAIVTSVIWRYYPL